MPIIRQECELCKKTHEINVSTNQLCFDCFISKIGAKHMMVTHPHNRKLFSKAGAKEFALWLIIFGTPLSIIGLHYGSLVQWICIAFLLAGNIEKYLMEYLMSKI